MNILAGNLDSLDFDVRYVAGEATGGYLLARPHDSDAGKDFQLLLGHCDTVWPIGTIESMPFQVDGNVIRGPGVYDMKGGLVQLIFALRILRDLNLDLEFSPVILINSDEEIGSPESTEHIKILASKAVRSFVLEPSLGPSGKLKTQRKGVGEFHIEVRGKAAHAGLDPDKGVSAILELSHIIQRLFEMNDAEIGVSVNVGVIEGGIRPNVIAPMSRAEIDCRTLSLADAQRVTNRILEMGATDPRIELFISGQFSKPPLEVTSRNRRLWDRAVQIGSLIGLELEEGIAGGGSDGNTTSQFTATLDGLGAVGDGAHADHEFIYVDKMIERTALLALLLLS
jgi:glutamate carboxypeptidase